MKTEANILSEALYLSVLQSYRPGIEWFLTPAYYPPICPPISGQSNHTTAFPHHSLHGESWHGSLQGPIWSISPDNHFQYLLVCLHPCLRASIQLLQSLRYWGRAPSLPTYGICNNQIWGHLRRHLG